MAGNEVVESLDDWLAHVSEYYQLFFCLKSKIVVLWRRFRCGWLRIATQAASRVHFMCQALF
jgi:hypothetical protein